MESQTIQFFLLIFGTLLMAAIFMAFSFYSESTCQTVKQTIGGECTIETRWALWKFDPAVPSFMAFFAILQSGLSLGLLAYIFQKWFYSREDN